MMKFTKLMFASAIALAVAAPAAAQTYAGGSGTFSGLGEEPGFPAQPGGPFDIATFTPRTGTYTGDGSYALNDVTFDVGFNRYTGSFPFSGFFALTGTFDGNPFTYNVAYSGVIDATDSITIGGNYITVQGTPVFLRALTFTNIGAGQRASGTLIAAVGGAVPEPASWALMIVGFGAAGYALRRRKVATTVSYA